MQVKLPLKKLIVELRYKPRLGFYGRMDSFGTELGDDYPDWERSGLTLEVQNKKKHRRLYLSADRSFIDVDAPDPDADFDRVEKLLAKLCKKFEITDLKRVGVRQWFAADLNKAFALLVDEFAERFLNRSDGLKSILADKIKDVAYVVDYETADGWRYNLRAGPMTKSQWLGTIMSDRNNFDRTEGATETIEKFRESIPEQFLFVDVDCYKEDHSADKLAKFMTAARRRSQEIVAKLIEYCKK
jgi:hypothetical protein